MDGRSGRALSRGKWGVVMNLRETSGIGITSDNIYYVNYDTRLEQNACRSHTEVWGVSPSAYPILLTPSTNATPLPIEYNLSGFWSNCALRTNLPHRWNETLTVSIQVWTTLFSSFFIRSLKKCPDGGHDVDTVQIHLGQALG